MGDPKRIRRKIFAPSHPWNKTRIDEEKRIMRDFGLSKKKEIWRVLFVLNGFKKQAKRLVSIKSAQSELETKNLFSKLRRQGIVKSEDITYDDVLELKIEDLLERRLQTMLVRKNLARTMKQARQLIIHKHITVNGRVVNSPSYFVSSDDEDKIEFLKTSPFSLEAHPERVVVKEPVIVETAEEDKKEDKNNKNK